MPLWIPFAFQVNECLPGGNSPDTIVETSLPVTSNILSITSVLVGRKNENVVEGLKGLG
jgi:hypothetical protein